MFYLIGLLLLINNRILFQVSFWNYKINKKNYGAYHRLYMIALSREAPDHGPWDDVSQIKGIWIVLNNIPIQLSISFFCTFSVFLFMCLGEFLFWSCLSGVLYAPCILIGISFFRLRIFFYDLLKIFSVLFTLVSISFL